MKNAILLHGIGRSPNDLWFVWMRAQLAAHGFIVAAPQMPDTEDPDVLEWTDYALDHLAFDEETVLIGHSAGCPAVLSILQKLDKPVRRTILVSGYVRLPDMDDDHPMLLSDPDWARIRYNGGEFFFLHSDNDPWGCTPQQGEAMRQRLGGALIVASGQGHFGSVVFDQPYAQFPLLLSLCLMEGKVNQV